MQLFYTQNITPPQYTLNEEESKHCAKVLRLQCGDTIHLTDGNGNLFCCQIIDNHYKRCVVNVISTQHEYEKLTYQLTMCVAPTKNIDRFEWFLEKATEVGVDEIIPIATSHSERRIIKLERSTKVVTSAMKQSLKAYHPTLHDITSVKSVIANPFDGRKFIAHCDTPQSEQGKRYLADTLKKGERALILIGPEGDFSPEEISLAIEHGFEEISLGSQRLRTETAGVSAVMMVSTINNQNI